MKSKVLEIIFLSSCLGFSSCFLKSQILLTSRSKRDKKLQPGCEENTE